MRVLAHAYVHFQLYSIQYVLCHARVETLTGLAILGVMALRTTIGGTNVTVQTLSTSGQEASVGQHQFGVRHLTPHPQSSNFRPVARPTDLIGKVLLKCVSKERKSE